MANSGRFQKGNQAAAKERVWAAAINQALEARGVSRIAALIPIANKLIDMAKEGDLGALKELGDRLDGRPAQVIQGDADQPVVVINRSYVEVEPDEPE